MKKEKNEKIENKEKERRKRQGREREREKKGERKKEKKEEKQEKRGKKEQKKEIEKHSYARGRLAWWLACSSFRWLAFGWLATLNIPSDLGLCSTSPPGGNQVDGLPPDTTFPLSEPRAGTR